VNIVIQNVDLSGQVSPSKNEEQKALPKNEKEFHEEKNMFSKEAELEVRQNVF
jgi:hypothetical protein